MKCPWLRLPAQAPFVYYMDEDGIGSRYPHQDADRKLHLECLPEPYLGRPDAPIVVLGLKPGFDPGDPSAHARTDFAEVARRSLAHEPLPYPVYLLDPRFASTPGGIYYREALGPLASALGARQDQLEHPAWKAIASECLFVNYFPYHSVATPVAEKPLNSQHYGFHLARLAVERSALILAVLGVERWKRSVKELTTVPRLFTASNTRTWSLSARNVPGGFEAVVEHLAEVLARPLAREP